MDRIRISSDLLAAIAGHAARVWPNECCGLLVGAGDRIDEVVATRNVLAHPSRYQIDPQEHIDTNRRLRGTIRSVVGAYHSHPRTDAVPSRRDLQEAYYPDFVWLIVSLKTGTPQYRLYGIAGGAATEIELVVESS